MRDDGALRLAERTTSSWFGGAGQKFLVGPIIHTPFRYVDSRERCCHERTAPIRTCTGLHSNSETAPRGQGESAFPVGPVTEDMHDVW